MEWIKSLFTPAAKQLPTPEQIKDFEFNGKRAVVLYEWAKAEGLDEEELIEREFAKATAKQHAEMQAAGLSPRHTRRDHIAEGLMARRTAA